MKLQGWNDHDFAKENSFMGTLANAGYGILLYVFFVFFYQISLLINLFQRDRRISLPQLMFL